MNARDWKVGDRVQLVTLNRRDPGPHPATIEDVGAEFVHVRIASGELYKVGANSSFLTPAPEAES